MIGLCRGEPPLGCFVLSSHYHIGRGSLSSEPWNKCGRFRKNKRIITIHSVFCSYFVSIFAGRAQKVRSHLKRQILCSQKLLLKRKQRFVYFENVVIFLFDKILNDDIKFIACGKSKSGS